MNAEVRWAQIWMSGAWQQPWAWGNHPGEEPRRSPNLSINRTIGEACVLIYPQSLLDQDGYVAVSLLKKIEKQIDRLVGIYGPPKDFGTLRGHLIAPIDDAIKSDLKIYDWGVLKWQDQTNRTT